MSRNLTIAAITSLFIHLAFQGMFPVAASNGNCATSGADGCSCQPYPCNANDVQISCRLDLTCSTEGCLTGSVSEESSYETEEGANATICTTSGPMVGAGCSNGTLTACKIVRSCPCDAFGYCQPAIEEEAGFFMPCTQN